MELRRSCEMLFVRNGEILLGKRGLSKHGAGTWALPGGHVELGEAADEAVIRETREELGVELSTIAANILRSGNCTVIVVDDRRPDAKPPVHYVHTAFTITVPSGVEAVNQEPSACVELRWFPKTELPIDNLYPPHVRVITSYTERRAYSSITGLR